VDDPSALDNLPTFMNRWRWILLLSHALAMVLGLWLSHGFKSGNLPIQTTGHQPKASLRERVARVPPARLLAVTNDWASMLEAMYSANGSVPYSEILANLRKDPTAQNRTRYREVVRLWFEREPDTAFVWFNQCSPSEIPGGAVAAAIDGPCGGDPIAFLKQTKDWNTEERSFLRNELASWCNANPRWTKVVYDELEKEQANAFLTGISMIAGPLPSPDLISILSDMPSDQSRRLIALLRQFPMHGSTSVTQAGIDEFAHAVSSLPSGDLRKNMEGLLAKAISNHLKGKIRNQAASDPAAAIRAVRAARLDEESASRFTHALQMAALDEGDAGLALSHYFQQVADAPPSLRNKFYKSAFAAALEVDPQQAIDSAISYLGKDAAIGLFPTHPGPDSNIHSHARFIACAAEAQLLPNEDDAIPETVRYLYRVDRKAANEWVLGLIRPESRRLAVDTLTGIMRMDDLASEAIEMRGKAGMEK
jgi:hypothetical protein